MVYLSRKSKKAVMFFFTNSTIFSWVPSGYYFHIIGIDYY
jgi:hypothetical protein